MTQGLILFGLELVKAKGPLSLSDVQPQKVPPQRHSARDRLPQSERSHLRVTAPELWPRDPSQQRVRVPAQRPATESALPTMPLTARARYGGRQMAAYHGEYGGLQDADDIHMTSNGGHGMATSSTLPRPAPWSSTRNFKLHSSNPESSSPGHTVSTRAHLTFGSLSLARPGTEERRSGSVAALDSSMLPMLHCAILKDDVRHASERMAEAELLAAEHRSKCHAEAKEKGRKKASFWRKQQLRRHRKLQDIAREEEERLERERQEAADAQAAYDADVRWKKAFDRIKTKETKRVALVGVTHASLGLESLKLSLASKMPRLRFSSVDTEQSHASSAGSGLPSPHREGSHSYDENVDEHSDDHSDAGEQPIMRGVKSLLSWRMKKGLHLDDHIHSLRKQQRLRNRSTRFAQQYEAKKARFNRLPEEEQKMCEAAYLHFGDQPYVRTLDTHAVRDCLHEVGARGISLDEQIAVLKVCLEAHNNAARTTKLAEAAEGTGGEDPFSELSHEVRMACLKGGINLYTFATGVVHTARKQLDTVRRAKVEDAFKAKDSAEEGFILLESVVEVIRSFSRIEDLSVEGVERQAAILFPQAKQKEKKEGEKEPKQAKAKHVHMASEDIPTWTLEQTQQLVLHYCTDAEVKACAQERRIQKEFEIDRDTFKVMRVDLGVLHDLYKKVVGDATRLLSIEECDRMFQEFGLHCNADQHVSPSGIDFVDLLSIVDQIRIDVEADAFDDLAVPFFGYPKVHHGGAHKDTKICIMDVQDFFTSVEITPKTIDERVAMSHALEDVLAMSAYEDDLLDFDQVKRVLQRFREKERRMRHSEEVQAAIATGFHEEELEDLHETFQILDADGSGSIDPDEAWGAIKTLGFQISKALFSAAYRQVDNDGSGSLEFVEFLKLLQLIRDRQGCFATDRHINMLHELLRAECLHLLALFHEFTEHEEAETLDDSELLMKVCSCFGAEPHDPIEKRLHVKTFQDLCALAEAIFVKRMQRGY